MKQTLLLVLILVALLSPKFAFPQARLVKDINQTANVPPEAYSTGASPVVETGDYGYFSAYNFANGRELFKTDGTQAGTTLVHDIVPGKDSSEPLYLTRHKNLLFFSAATAAHGRELWVSDGTAGGTRLVKDLAAGPDGSTPASLVSAGEYLYFTCIDKVNGFNVWRTDGTAAGTVMIKSSLSTSGLRFLTAVNDRLVYATFGGVLVTDGTPAGTQVLLHTGSSGRTINIFSGGNNKLYISGEYEGNSAKLWETDGTVEGTKPLPVIKHWVTRVTALDDLLVYTYGEGTNEYEVWRTDGTEGGTYMLKDIYPGPRGSNPNSLQTINGVAYFIAYSPQESYHRLWRTDGSPEGTYKVCEAAISLSEYGLWHPIPEKLLYASNGKIYFQAIGLSGPYNTAQHSELWVTDGTEAGSHSLVVSPPNTYLNFANLSSSRHGLYFNDSGQLWKTDGTDSGTELVADLTKNTKGSISSYNKTIEINGRAYFVATDGIAGDQLWVSDGTTAGTRPELDDTFDAGSMNNLTKVGNNLYFTASIEESDNILWKLSTTKLSTPSIKWQPLARRSVTNLAAKSSTLFFVTAHMDYGLELWLLDENAKTPAGQIVADINPGRADANPSNLTLVGNTLFFTATTAANGEELWKSDGTSFGTMLVNDLTPGTASSKLASLTAVNKTLYFTLNSELWKSNGTKAGTVLVKPVPGIQQDPKQPFALVGDILYFAVKASSSAQSSLWRSDGTSEGTYEITFADKGSSFHIDKGSIANVNGEVFFVTSAYLDNIGRFKQLWKSDGTNAGTKLVKNLHSQKTYITDAASVAGVSGGSMFFFTKEYDPKEYRYYLWKSDGTAEGTYQVHDFGHTLHAPGNAVATGNNKILFAASERETGRELWAFDNILPTSEDKALSVSSASPYHFYSGDFPFTDADEKDRLYSIVVSALPQKGKLLLRSKVVTLNQEIKAQDIAHLTFEAGPEAETPNEPYTSFRYRVNDALENSAAAYTFTIHLQESPASADVAVRISAVEPHKFSKEGFPFESAIPNDELSFVKVLDVPANTGLWLNGQLVKSGTEIPVTELTNLTFVPDAEATTASFLFKVKGSTSYSNGNYSYAFRVNNIPTAASKEILVEASDTYDFSAQDFAFNDKDSEDKLAGVLIRSLPVAGALTLHGKPLSLDQYIEAADLAGLAYTLATTDTSSLYFQVYDGIDYSSSKYKFMINYNMDTPSSANKTVRVSKQIPYALSKESFTFIGTRETDKFDVLKVVELPTNGILRFNDFYSRNPIVAGTELSPYYLSHLIFVPNAGATTASFLFKVKGSTSYSSRTYSYTFLINNTPSSSNKVVLAENTESYTFSAKDFEFTDTDSEDGLAAILIRSLPATGTLTLHGKPVLLGLTIDAADLANLVHTKAMSDTSTFHFQVHDGLDYSVNTYKISLKYSSLTSADEAHPDAKVQVYPNPSSGIFHVISPANALIRSLKVYNTLGKEIMAVENCNAFEKSIDLLDAGKGTYFIEVTLSSGRTIRKKVLKH